MTIIAEKSDSINTTPNASLKPTNTLAPQNLPHEMRLFRNWIGYRLEWNAERQKFSKIPFSPHGNYKASTTEPKHWGTFEQALEAVQRCGYDGIGFVFTGTGLFGGDLDHCVINGVIADWAQTIIDSFATYAEFSISGTGVHIIGKGTMPNGGKGKKRGDIEAYSTDRFFTMSGNVVPGAVETVEDRQAELTAFVTRTFPDAAPAPARALPAVSRPATDQSIAAMLDKARQAKNGSSFSALYDRGDLAAAGGDESRADFSLCCHLAFWLGGDHAAIDNAFRSSALMRDKWDQRRGEWTYGERTITRAVGATPEVYIPPTPITTIKPSLVRRAATAPPIVPTSEQSSAQFSPALVADPNPAPVTTEEDLPKEHEEDLDLPGIVALARSQTANLPVCIRPMGLTVFESATEKDFAQIATRLYRVKGALDAPHMFWLSDVYHQLPQKYGARIDWARRNFGKKWEAIYNDMRKAGCIGVRWQEPERRLGLPKSFYIEAASLPEERRVELARKYDQGETVSISAIRAEKAASRPSRKIPKEWKAQLEQLADLQAPKDFVTGTLEILVRRTSGNVADRELCELLVKQLLNANLPDVTSDDDIVPTSEQLEAAPSMEPDAHEWGDEDAPPLPDVLETFQHELTQRPPADTESLAIAKENPKANCSADIPRDYKKQNNWPQQSASLYHFPEDWQPSVDQALALPTWSDVSRYWIRFCDRLYPNIPFAERLDDFNAQVSELRRRWEARNGPVFQRPPRWERRSAQTERHSQMSERRAGNGCVAALGGSVT